MFLGNLSIVPQPTITDEKLEVSGNITAKVVPGTLHALPWAGPAGVSIGQVLCECFEVAGGLPKSHRACTRTIARKQMERLQEKFGLRLYAAFECEFQLLHKETCAPLFQTSDTLSQMKLAEYEDFLCRMLSYLSETGIKVEAFHIEGAPSQFEFALVPTYGMTTLDYYIQLKNSVKEISMKEGYLATFMTQPLALSGCGNTGHFNHSLWNSQGQNVFHNAKEPSGMSSTFQHWIAGLLKHTPALTALCCPTVNCYRHLHQQWTPHVADWDMDNRHVAYRVKTISPHATYLESRMVTSAANPYLVGAGIVAAGIDGLEKKLELPPAGPCHGANILPKTLEEAMAALNADGVIKEALGEEFVSLYTREKVKSEVKYFNSIQASASDVDVLAKERDVYIRVI